MNISIASTSSATQTNDFGIIDSNGNNNNNSTPTRRKSSSTVSTYSNDPDSRYGSANVTTIQIAPKIGSNHVDLDTLTGEPSNYSLNSIIESTSQNELIAK
uniref:Uncharacterized protein n=1 Tax=Panagrolaimus sp. JU765 TaxID=591449 RepID=A0AC34QCX2_9BILA